MARFEELAVGNYSGGVTRYSMGPYTIFIDIIPDDAPQDWLLGPTMKPGEYGAFLANDLHPRRHSPYAIATGKTEEEARGKAIGFFRGPLDVVGQPVETFEDPATGKKVAPVCWERVEP